MIKGNSTRAASVVRDPLDRPLWITQFASVTRRRGVRERTSLRELRSLIRATSAPRKEELPLFKLALFSDNLRSNATLRSIQGVEGDYDGETMKLSEAARRLEEAKVAAFLYSSASSKPGAPRWRVLCPTSRPLGADQQSKLLARVNGVLGGALASESFNP